MRSVLLILMALSSFSMAAQEKRGKISGQVVLASEEQTPSGGVSRIVLVQDKRFFLIPVPNATVELITGRDTLRKVSDGNGYYTFSDIPFGEYLIKARHISYISAFQKVKHTIASTKKDIQMKEEIFLLDAIKVKGEIPLLTTRGDTVVINPLAVKTMEGDAAIEILRQVPGIKINEITGAITAFGKVLTRTYVGGKLIFGEDARVALDNLDATLVKKMKVYDEVTDLDMTEDGRFEAKTRRVLNIETTKEILSSRTGHAIAGLGKDLKNDGAEGNNTRYRLGGTINFFSEKLFYNANIFTNNTNTPNNRVEDNQALISKTTGEEKIAFAGVGYKKVWGDNNIGSNLQVDYSFNNRNSSKEKTLENIYFPNDIYSQREYRSINSSTQSKAEHKAAINYRSFGKVNGKKKYISLSNSMIFSDTDMSDYSEITNIVNEKTDRLNQTKLNNTDNYHIRNNINTDIITHVNLTLSGDFRKDNGESWRADTSFSDQSVISEKIYKSSPVGSNVNMSAKVSYRNFPSRFTYDYQIDYQKGKAREIRYDLSNPGLESIDNIHSYDYSTNHTTHIAKLSFDHMSHTINAENKGSAFFPYSASISFKSVSVNKDELVPETLNYSKTFNSILFSLDLGSGFGGSEFYGMHFTSRYNTYTVIPSVEQLRNQINDSDPLFLVAGNSNLKQTYVHNFAAQMRSLIPDLSFTLEAAIMKNQIIPKQKFFLTNTVLPEYNNYHVPANSTLTTYENLNGAITSSLKTYYSTRISSIKTLFTLTSELNYSRRPSFIQEKENITNSYGCLLKLSFATSFASFKINMSSSNEYLQSINTERKRSEYFNENFNFSYDYNIGKYFFTRGKYNMVLYEPLTKGNIGFTNNILSLSGGLRLFKGKMNIDLTVYDILNKSTNFKSMMYSDYVQNSWTPTFGRYWSFNVTYKFRSTKSPSNIRLNDGFVPTN